MRLPWFSQRYSQRGATRRKRAAPLKVRRLERRRVLDAAVTDLVFTAADLDPSTAAHDSGEGTPITVSANATGFASLTDADRLPSPDRDGTVVSLRPFAHLAYVRISQGGGAEDFEIPVPIVGDWNERVCRIPLDRAAGEPCAMCNPSDATQFP